MRRVALPRWVVFGVLASVVSVAPGDRTTAASGSASLAAPWAIIAHGRLLKEPIIIADWHENLRLMLATPGPGTATNPRLLRDRPYVDLALFWGPAWAHLPHSPQAVAQLRANQGNQRAWLFPATRESPAVMVYDPPAAVELSPQLLTRAVQTDGIAMLSQHGVPVRIP
jgi:hypothetical protein